MSFGLLGQHLSHSLSPLLHQEIGGYPYHLYEIEPQRLQNFFMRREFDGINVTIPYKKMCLPYCDLLTPIARQLGNVNLIRRLPDGRLLGDNTDITGFTRLLSDFPLSAAGKKVLILGTGGAGTTAEQVLCSQGAKTVMISRTGRDHYQNLDRHADARLIVNATPVGMYPKLGCAPLSLSHFPHLEGVIDLIYNPLQTMLLFEARERALATVNGLPMLVGQALTAIELFGGKPLPADAFTRGMALCRRTLCNLLLIGMPGCGKTSVGRLLAKRLDLPFADCDEVFEKSFGQSPADFLAQHTEADFREKEAAILDELTQTGGKVIATGGGAVCTAAGRRALSQNGFVVYLTRPAEELECSGRPLSNSPGALQRLYRQRAGYYEAFSDLKLPCADSAEKTAKNLQKELLSCGF